MRIGKLIEGLGIRGRSGSEAGTPVDAEISDLTEDSRTASPGSLFIARAGAKADGKTYVADAVRAGAVAVLTDDPALAAPSPAQTLVSDGADFSGTIARLGDRFFGSPSEHLAVIGVTGTNGKTTITYLMHQMLNALGVRCGLMGTVMIDDGERVSRATHTTPPPLEVSRMLARMVGTGCRAAAMEVSSHALHQGRVAAVRFGAGVFTNLTGDHLDYHGTMDRYAAAKALLFEGLGPDAFAVVNVMDPAHTRMVRGCRFSS